MSDDVIHPALSIVTTASSSVKSSFSLPPGSKASANSSKASSKRSSTRSSINLPRSVSAPDGPSFSLYAEGTLETKLQDWLPPSPRPRKGSMSDLSEIHLWTNSNAIGLIGVLSTNRCKKTRISVLLWTATIEFAMMMLGGIFAALYHLYYLLGGLLFVSCLTVVSLLHFRKTGGTFILQLVVLINLLLVPFVLQLFTNQFGRGGSMILWTFLCPLLALITGSTSSAMRWFVAFFALGALVTLGSILLPFTQGLLWTVPEKILPALSFFDTYVIFLITFLSMVYVVHELEKTMRVKDGLLQSMFPESVVEKFIENQIGEEGLIETVPTCTILFADLVGFTQIAGSMTAEKLVSLLNCVFTEFDRLARLYGVEKIKTIGDAYMAAHGLPRDGMTASEQDPGVVADMALAMIPAIRRVGRRKGVPGLKVRIGIASGNVVAGVIGKCKFAYDIWGDAVNVASRMESTGAPDRIHCSENIYKTLRNRYLFDCRGLTQVKGKGEMVTYYLCSRLQADAADIKAPYFGERLWDRENEEHLISPDYFIHRGSLVRNRSPSPSSQDRDVQLSEPVSQAIDSVSPERADLTSELPGSPPVHEEQTLNPDVDSGTSDGFPTSPPNTAPRSESDSAPSRECDTPSIELASPRADFCPPILATAVSPLQSIPTSPLVHTSYIPSDPDTPSPTQKRRLFRIRISRKHSSFEVPNSSLQMPEIVHSGHGENLGRQVDHLRVPADKKDNVIPGEDSAPQRLSENDGDFKRRRRKKRRRSILRKGSVLLRRALLADCLPIWMFSQAEQVDLLVQMYDDLGLIQMFGIDEKKLRVFCTASIEEYGGLNCSNAFHNWEHAMDVCHTSYLFLRRTKAGQLIPPYAQLALLTAAIGHDMAHPGLTNGYQQKAKTPLYALYGRDTSGKSCSPILEQYHLSRLFATLNRSNADFLSHLHCCQLPRPITPVVPSDTEESGKDTKSKRSDGASSLQGVDIFDLMKELVIATDMAQHSKYVGLMESVDLTSMDQESNLMALLCMLLKCADVSNTVKPSGLCKVWASRIMNEFYAQGDLEKHQHLLPVSPLCDRERDCDIPSIQVGFIKFLQPMWRMMAEKVEGFDVFFKQTERNIIMWEEQKRQEPSAQSSPETSP